MNADTVIDVARLVDCVCIYVLVTSNTYLSQAHGRVIEYIVIFAGVIDHHLIVFDGR